MWLLPGIRIEFLSALDSLASAHGGEYSWWLVLCSLAIAIFAAYNALAVTQRLGRGEHGLLWTTLAALMLGLGTWSMHFIGMLAFHIDIPLQYDAAITALSVLPAIVASVVTLHVYGREVIDLARLLLAGVVMGAGIGLMHYSGMAAISLEGEVRYDRGLFAASIAVAVVLAIPALGMRELFRRFPQLLPQRLQLPLSGIVLGLAISAMHYTAMRSAVFLHHGTEHLAATQSHLHTGLAVAVGFVTLLLLGSGSIFMLLGTRMQEFKRRMESLLATTSQGFLMLDADGMVIDHNPAVLAMLATDADNLRGRHVGSFLQSADAVAQAPQTELALIRSDGSALPCLASVNALVDPERQQNMTFLLLTDISQRVAAQQELAARERELDVLLDSAPDPMLVADMDGCILRVNQEAERFFGYPRADLEGRPVEVLIPERFRAGHPFLRGGYGKDPAMRSVKDAREFFALRRDGSEVPVSIGLRPVLSAGRRLIFIALHDLSRQKEFEQVLRKAKEAAEDADRMKSSFLANMSHEIRTPMNAILGLSHLLQHTALDEQQQDYLGKIIWAGKTLTSLLNDILDISKIEAGKLTIENIEFELWQVLENLLTISFDKARSKGLELIFDIDPRVPEFLVGDPVRLGQIMNNFVSNALKFTEHGQISIRLLLQEESADDIVLLIEVSDTGIGLSELQIGRLFQDFQQADASTTRKYGGTGLGLSICKRLSQLMGGEVGVRSSEGKGSTFWSRIRLGKGQQVRKPLLPAAELHGRRMLVVDDNEQARTVLCGMLANMGFVVDSAAGGEDAIAMTRQADAAGLSFDIVFMDWQMPGMDGLEAARRMRMLELRQQPKVVIVTAYGSEIRAAGSDAGITEVISKPVNASAIFDAVMRLLATPGSAPRREQLQQRTRASAELSSIHGARVLLAEDNELNQIVASGLLRQYGLMVDIARNGEQAVAMVQQMPYQLVLMDMQMPVLDGVEATRRIRRLPDLKELPIVAMTANAMDTHRDECLQAGMNDFITKPIDPEVLQAKLLEWINPAGITTLARMGEHPEEPVVPVAGRLEGLAGLDTTAALKRLLGNRPLYLQLLRKFCAEQQDFDQRLGAALEAPDAAGAMLLVHSLKGVAGTLGAGVVQQEAAELENLLRAAAPAEQRELARAGLSVALARLLQDLAAALPAEEAATPVQQGDQPGVAEASRTLAALLARDSFDAQAYLLEHRAVLQARLGSSFDQLAELVGNFRFDEAARLLDSAVPQAAGDHPA